MTWSAASSLLGWQGSLKQLVTWSPAYKCLYWQDSLPIVAYLSRKSQLILLFVLLVAVPYPR